MKDLARQVAANARRLLACAAWDHNPSARECVSHGDGRYTITLGCARRGCGWTNTEDVVVGSRG